VTATDQAAEALSPAPDARAPTETAMIAAVQAAEPLVSGHCQQLDVGAGCGVPAHVPSRTRLLRRRRSLTTSSRSWPGLSDWLGARLPFCTDALVWSGRLVPRSRAGLTVPTADRGVVASLSATPALRRCLRGSRSAPNHCRVAVGRFAYPPRGRAGCAVRPATRRAMP
jgi:hypothetical protein